MIQFARDRRLKEYLDCLTALASQDDGDKYCSQLASIARDAGKWPHALAFGARSQRAVDLVDLAAREIGVPAPKYSTVALPHRLRTLLLTATQQPTDSLSWAMLSLECAKCQHWPLSLAFALDAFAFSHPQGQVRALAVHLIELSSARIGVQPRTRYLEQLADASI